jgi:hypothetical protein
MSITDAYILNRGHRCNKEDQPNLIRNGKDTAGLRVREVGAVNENTMGLGPHPNVHAREFQLRLGFSSYDEQMTRNWHRQ